MRKLVIIASSLALVLATAAAAQAKPAKSFTITSSISTSRLILGDPITVTGQVSPASSSTVSVYVQYAGFQPGEYQFVGTDQLNSRSKYTKTFTPAYSGPSKVMVVKGKSGSRVGASTKKSFSNYADFPLTKLAKKVVQGSVVSSTSVDFTPTDANKPGYLFSGIDNGAAKLQVSLSGQCSRFYTGSGVDYSSPAGTEGTSKISSAVNGTTLTALPTVTAVRGDEPHTQNLALEKVVKGKRVAATSLVITTDVDTEGAAWGLALSEVRCNLPGATILG